MVHTFPYKNLWLALDEYSGAVHVLDDNARLAIVRLAEGASADEVLSELEPAMGADDARELLDEIDMLRDAGQLFAEPPQLSLERTPGEIKALCLHVAHDCDLRCSYCFAGTGSFHGGRSLMSPEVGRAALDFLFSRSGSRNVLEVDFFGGEPLLNFPMVKETVAYGRQLERQTGKKVRFTLTTNGMGLDGDVGDFLNREMYNVVISIDGRPEVHDALRKRIDGQGSHAQILANAQRFVETRGDKSYYVRGTFTNRNLDFAQDVLYLADQGFDNVSVEPAVLSDKSPLALQEEHLEAILAEYGRLAEMLADRRDEGRGFLFFHFNIDFGGGPCVYKRLSGCGAGDEYVAITPEGDIYPCHQFVGETQFRLGNVMTGELDRERMKPFRRDPAMELTKCQDCWAKMYCGGGCAANAWHKNGDINSPYDLECQMERRRVECAAQLWALQALDGNE